MNRAKIKAAARKALMAADPDYYSWSAQQQEYFRVTMDNAARSRVEAVLLNDLLGIQCTAENAGAVKRIRWKHFLADCEALLADISSVTERASQERARAEIWLQETHAGILKNFDPTVVKLKKKMKVIVASGAFDSLESGNEGE